MSLPSIAVFIKCGHCYEELDHDGEVYHCDHCGLEWSGDPFREEPATFRDDRDGEQPAACGAEPEHPHRQAPPEVLGEGDRVPHYWPEGARVREFSYELLPCDLPAGHETREHHYPTSEGVFTFRDEDGEVIPDVVRT